MFRIQKVRKSWIYIWWARRVHSKAGLDCDAIPEISTHAIRTIAVQISRDGMSPWWRLPTEVQSSGILEEDKYALQKPPCYTAMLEFEAYTERPRTTTGGF
jgi:hypothetical protein